MLVITFCDTLENVVFHVKQAAFEGPLELLLELIEKDKLPVSEISLGKVAEEYLKHVRSLEFPDPEALAEFLVVAAQLMFIKSRSLLPSLTFSEEEEASIEELERRLQDYRKFRELALALGTLEDRKMCIATREPYQGKEPLFFPPPELAAGDLWETFLSVLAHIPKVQHLVQDKIKRVLSLEEKIRQIRTFIEGAVERAFSELVSGAADKVDVIVAFLAILELTRQRFVDVRQSESFGDILITRIEPAQE